MAERPICLCVVDGGSRCPTCQQWDKLPALWQAIVNNTKADDMFWLGEILLNELAKETGYKGPLAGPIIPAPTGTPTP